jgi:hypothetical protein
MKILALLLIIFMGSFQAVYAQDILLSTNQTEYYFKTGENAVIPIEINNTYGKRISGILQYTISQLINQGNIQLSNYNTEKKSLSLNEESNKVSLDVGKSDTPSNFTVNLNFNYNENGDRIVPLGPIIIHFVSDESQKNTHQQNNMQSSSQPNTHSKQQDLFSQQQQQMEQGLNELLGNQQDLFSQQQQHMEQKLNELIGNQQNQSQNQQQLQNNQLDQDSNTLKQQLEKQVQKQEQTKKEFEQKLFSNNEFLNRDRNLLKNGYNINSSNLNALSNDTGSFDIKYNNTNGKWATLQGNMKNGAVPEINEQSQDKRDKLLEKLKQNTMYQQFNSKLLTEGFSQNDIAFEANGNKTNITLKYDDQKHANATITANFVNDEIKQVTLEDRNSNRLNLMLLIIIAVIIVSAIFIYFAIKKFKNKKSFTIIDTSSNPKKSFDHVTESKQLMDKAIQYRDKRHYKEAFGTAGKSIRLFLSYDAGIKREITSEELIRLIQKNNYPIDDIRECLKITDLVEFAKLKATEYDFNKIISLFNKLSNEQNIDNR